MSAPWLDGCPGCVVNTELPKASVTLAGAVRCAYQCGDCGHSWTTDWSTESVDAVSDFPLISWENVDEKREPDRANESDSLATVSTTAKGA